MLRKSRRIADILAGCPRLSVRGISHIALYGSRSGLAAGSSHRPRQGHSASESHRSPRVNGAGVYGVRPNHRFLYRIPTQLALATEVRSQLTSAFGNSLLGDSEVEIYGSARILGKGAACFGERIPAHAARLLRTRSV
jgi:hypothetical protein